MVNSFGSINRLWGILPGVYAIDCNLWGPEVLLSFRLCRVNFIGLYMRMLWETVSKALFTLPGANEGPNRNLHMQRDIGGYSGSRGRIVQFKFVVLGIIKPCFWTKH